MDPKEQQLAKPQVQTEQFPSLESTFKEAWERLTQGIGPLIVFNIIGFVPMFIFIFLFIVVFLAAAVGGVAALGKNPQALLQLLFSPQVIVGISVGYILLMVIFSLISSWMYAGLILSLKTRAEGRGTLGELLKTAFKKALPLFFVTLLISFFFMGGFFVFIVPGIAFLILFLFSPLVVVLEEEKGLSALRRSMGIASAHFWTIFLRLILLWVIIMGVSILVGFFQILASLSKEVGSLITILSYIFNIVVGWYMLAFVVTLYQQAKSITDPAKRGKLLWPTIIAVIGLILAFIMLFATINGIRQLVASGALEKMMASPKKTTQMQQTFNQQAADALADNTFAAINSGRIAQGLSPVDTDTNLCAYAQRRLQQLDLFGRLDDHKGFIEDKSNNYIIQTYFSSYDSYGEMYTTGINMATGKQIADGWAKSKNSLTVDKTVTNACVRANPNFMIVITGVKAKNSGTTQTYSQPPTPVPPNPTLTEFQKQFNAAQQRIQQSQTH